MKTTINCNDLIISEIFKVDSMQDCINCFIPSTVDIDITVTVDSNETSDKIEGSKYELPNGTFFIIKYTGEKDASIYVKSSEEERYSCIYAIAVSLGYFLGNTFTGDIPSNIVNVIMMECNKLLTEFEDRPNTTDVVESSDQTLDMGELSMDELQEFLEENGIFPVIQEQDDEGNVISERELGIEEFFDMIEEM